MVDYLHVDAMFLTMYVMVLSNISVRSFPFDNCFTTIAYHPPHIFIYMGTILHFFHWWGSSSLIQMKLMYLRTYVLPHAWISSGGIWSIPILHSWASRALCSASSLNTINLMYIQFLSVVVLLLPQHAFGNAHHPSYLQILSTRLVTFLDFIYALIHVWYSSSYCLFQTH